MTRELPLLPLETESSSKPDSRIYVYNKVTSWHTPYCSCIALTQSYPLIMVRNLIQTLLRPTGYYLRSKHHFGDGYWADLVMLMRRRNSKVPIIFDVGAHHGETLVSARKHFPTASVHCFEPDPESFEILRSRATDSTRIKLHPVALGAVAGRAAFHRNCESMTNSLLPTSSESLASDMAGLTSTQATIEVPVDTLDAVCARENIDWIDLLKTDCQGYDLMVLQGGEKMLSSNRIGLITCEVIFDREYDGQGGFYELLGLLDTHGYRLMGFYNMARNRANECTFCDAMFALPSKKPE
jgi:FkbM family methyltransferase